MPAGRPSKPLIDPQIVVEKALEIIDRDGIDRLSIRSLASSLGVSPPALYYHFVDKDDIVERVAKHVLDHHAKVTIDRSGTWQDQLVSMVRGSANALAEHPNLLPVLARRSDRRFAPDQYDVVAKLAMDNGVPANTVLMLFDTLEALLLGVTLLVSNRPDEIPFGDSDDRFGDLRRALEAAPSSHDLLPLAVRALTTGWSTEAARPPKRVDHRNATPKAKQRSANGRRPKAPARSSAKKPTR